MRTLNTENEHVQMLLEKSKAELVMMLLESNEQKMKYKTESEWLDQLADLLRDADSNEDFNREEQEIRDEYEETTKANKKYFSKRFNDKI